MAYCSRPLPGLRTPRSHTAADRIPGGVMSDHSSYDLEIARAWAAYHRKFPFLTFYQFAAAFKAGWDSKSGDSL